MAKPKHGKQFNYNSHPFPSQAALAALALVAAAPSVVAGSPLPTPPPEFLCPFIKRDILYPSTSSAAPTTPAHIPPHHAVADRYVEGSDRLWRKISSWTLYGSTCCTGSTSSTPPPPSQTPAPTPTPTPTSTSTYTSASATTAFDTSSLPAGWNNTNSTSPTESTTILALAIVLAGSICVFILGCLVWRRRKRKARDIERKRGHTLPADDGLSGVLQEKDAHGKMRTWARASARWKSNIRQSARRRRKRPLASSAANRPSSPTPRTSVDAPTSRRGSLSTEEPVPATVLRPDDSSSDTQHDSRPPSPPTYGASIVPRFAHTPPTSPMCNLLSTPPPDRPQSAQSGTQPSFIDEEPPYIPRSDGHVAMDDKSHLARIRDLASSPPSIQSSESVVQSVSAPEWNDVEDDLEGLGVDLSETPMAVPDFGFLPSLPPPTKSDVSFGYLDAHPLRYGNAEDMPGPPISDPSGSPSAPPIDYPGLEPSAPSLDEDDLFQDWDAASSYISEAPTSADQDATPTRATDSSPSPAVPSTSRSLLPPFRQTATRNSILPQYYP